MKTTGGTRRYWCCDEVRQYSCAASGAECCLHLPLRRARLTVDDSLRTRVQRLLCSSKFPQAYKALTAPARSHWPSRHSHTASPCRARTYQPANRTSVSCLQHTFLSSCGCCALQLPAARRCGVGCAVINEQEPRTGAQEPLLWDSAPVLSVLCIRLFGCSWVVQSKHRLAVLL